MLSGIRISANLFVTVDDQRVSRDSSTDVRFELAVYGILVVNHKTRDGVLPGNHLRWAGLLRSDKLPEGSTEVFENTDYRNSFIETSHMREAIGVAAGFMTNVS